MNQIILPLLTIAGLLSTVERDRYRSDLLSFVQGADQQTREIGYGSIEAAIIRVLSSSHRRGEQPTCKEICDAVIFAESENVPGIERWLGPRKIGDMLRELGFSTKHTAKGAIAVIDQGRLEGLERKYGVEVVPPQPRAGQSPALPLIAPSSPSDE